MNRTPSNILIATGIYPPEIGGPAEYAKNLSEIWRSQGYEVNVLIFSIFNWLPSGLRHFVYFLFLIPCMFKADYVFIIDTFSAALPATFLAWLIRKKTVLRTGGDFLWETYVTRTEDNISIEEFYKTKIKELSLKEKVIFMVTKWLLHHTDTIVWSTEWQKNIFMEPYKLQNRKHKIVENYYGERRDSVLPQEKNFIASSRQSIWKNIPTLQKVFSMEKVVGAGALLDLETVPHGYFLEKIKRAYAVIVISTSDISPNVILDAILYKKPFILTKETGIYDRVKDIAIFIDPKNEDEIAEKICWLSIPENYEAQKKKIEDFTFVHKWEDIAYEYMSTYENIQNESN